MTTKVVKLIIMTSSSRGISLNAPPNHGKSPVLHPRQGFLLHCYISGLSLQIYYFLLKGAKVFYSCSCDEVSVLYTNSSDTGEDELRFKGDDHSLCKHIFTSCSQYGELVDLQPETMTNKLCLLTNTHKVLFGSLLLCKLKALSVQLCTSRTWSRNIHYLSMHTATKLM